MSKVDRPPPQTIRNGQTDGTDGGSPSLPSRPFHILNEATKKKCFGRESTERVVLRHWKTKGICPVVQMIKVKLFMVLKLHKKTFFCTDATAIRSISFGRISEKRKHHTKSQTGHICQTLKWSECFVGQREASQIPDFLGYCFCLVPHVNCCCEREPPPNVYFFPFLPFAFPPSLRCHRAHCLRSV